MRETHDAASSPSDISAGMCECHGHCRPTCFEVITGRRGAQLRASITRIICQGG